MNWVELGRFCVIAGSVILAIGVLFIFSDKIPLGRLPGDLRFGGERVKIYVPLMTCVLVSVLLTLIVNFLSRK